MLIRGVPGERVRKRAHSVSDPAPRARDGVDGTEAKHDGEMRRACEEFEVPAVKAGVHAPCRVAVAAP